LGKTPCSTFFPFYAAELEVLTSYTLSAEGGRGAVDSEMRMRYGEDAYKPLLQKRELRRIVFAAFAALAKYSPTSDSRTLDSGRTMRSFAASSIWNASSSLPRCNGEKKLLRVLSSSDICRIFRPHARPLGLRFDGMPPDHSRCTTKTEQLVLAKQLETYRGLEILIYLLIKSTLGNILNDGGDPDINYIADAIPCLPKHKRERKQNQYEHKQHAKGPRVHCQALTQTLTIAKHPKQAADR
jgi:hypothetical protein